MTIKSDLWIRRMALERGMIEPFEEKQVRQGVISYGISSYGYDIRVADEFKIFTNVRSTIVDPKAFDENSFVDFRGAVCIVPPNSFALARTVERFRIPRSTIGVTVGKSTYARCFRGDTRVALVDGTAPTLEEMADRAREGEMFWGYGLGRFGRIVVALLDAPRWIARDSLLEVELDHGGIVRCTPDHVFIRRDGRSAPACDLRPGDSLMPLYRQLVRGYESVYQPLNGHLLATHRLADEWNVEQGIYEAVEGTHRHHLDHDRRNNSPWNIERVPGADHIRHHNAEYYGEGFDAEDHSAAIRSALDLRALDAAWRARQSEAQSIRARSFWADARYERARATLRVRQVESWSDSRRAAKSQELKRLYSDPEERKLQGERSRRSWEASSPQRRDRQREVARGIRSRAEVTAETVLAALHEAGTMRGAARLLECDRSVFRRFPGVVAKFKGLPVPNHRVTAIRELGGDHDVYCLTVPETDNFALDAGVFVSNCGIIVNVTPLEPEWEGIVTIEISNTTPLPARIYANEGIAQILFFESDEVCAVSYSDRKGKYQGQEGVTPPRL